MGFDISIGVPQSSFNIGFGSNPPSQASFDTDPTFDAHSSGQINMDAGFQTNEQAYAGFNSGGNMSADFAEASAIYYDTEENWNLQRDLIAKYKAVYVYSNHAYLVDTVGNRTPVPAIKVGDGTSYLIDMPFVDQDIRNYILDHISNDSVHVSERDRRFWNNKVFAFVYKNDPERLVLSKILNL